MPRQLDALVPVVGTGVRQVVREAPTDGNGLPHLVGAVVPVVEPEAAPANGALQVPVIDEADLEGPTPA